MPNSTESPYQLSVTLRSGGGSPIGVGASGGIYPVNALPGAIVANRSFPPFDDFEGTVIGFAGVAHSFEVQSGDLYGNNGTFEQFSYPLPWGFSPDGFAGPGLPYINPPESVSYAFVGRLGPQGPGLYRPRWLARRAGLYQLLLELGGETLLGSPRSGRQDGIVVYLQPQLAAAAALTADGPGATQPAFAGLPATFALRTADSGGNAVDDYGALLPQIQRGLSIVNVADTGQPAYALQPLVVYRGDDNPYNGQAGLYTVTVTPRVAGTLRVSTVIGGTHAGGSPYRVPVFSGAVSPRRSFAYGPGLLGAVAGTKALFFVRLVDEAGSVAANRTTVARLRVSAAASGGAPQGSVLLDPPVLVPGLGDVAVGFTATVRGSADVSVQYQAANGTLTHVGGSPFLGIPVQASATAGNVDPAQSLAFGPGLRFAQAGQCTGAAIVAVTERGLVGPVPAAAASRPGSYVNLIVLDSAQKEVTGVTPTTLAFNGSLAAALARNGLSALADLPGAPGASFVVSFCPTSVASGPYTLLLTLDGQALGADGAVAPFVSRSSYAVPVFSAETSAEDTLVYFDTEDLDGGLQFVAAGAGLRLLIEPYDRFGNPQDYFLHPLDEWVVLVSGPQALPTDVGRISLPDSRLLFALPLNATVAGVYSVAVQLALAGGGAVPVPGPGARLFFQVLPGPIEPAACSVSGDGLVRAEVGVRAQIRLSLADAFGNALADGAAAVAAGATWVLRPVAAGAGSRSIPSPGPGRFTWSASLGQLVADYTPPQPGRFLLDVSLGNRSVPLPGYSGTVVYAGPLSGPKCVAVGPGTGALGPLEAGQTTAFTIEARDAGGNRLSTGGAVFVVQLLFAPSPDEAQVVFRVPSGNITDNADGSYSVAYTPSTPGSFTLQVRIEG